MAGGKRVINATKEAAVAFAKKVGDFTLGWDLVDKLKAFGADAGKLLEAVVSGPLGVVGNLLGGLKIGFEKFFDNIGTNILGGLWKWLFGNIELPTLKRIAADLDRPEASSEIGPHHGSGHGCGGHGCFSNSACTSSSMQRLGT